jgi:5,10-methylenetetrahydromethanopterin reductase
MASMAEIGISIDGRAPLVEIEAQARAAEEGGATTLWIACHLFLRDPVTTAALALAATRKIKIALMAMSPYSTHPVYIAMAVASLEEKYPGRVILCLGAGAPADLKAAGIDSPKPLVAIAEAVTICRQLFAGEMADFQGRMFKVAGRRLANGGRAIPIVLAASRPNMLKLAGRETDGPRP